MVDDRHLTNAQQLALALDRNLSVIAGAGTGKTQVLTRRFLRILESNRDADWLGRGVACPPQYLVAVTFTRKAAEEMRARVAKEIGKRLAAARAQQDEDAHAYWMQMRRALDDTTITTIHGLAMKIVLDHALLVGIDPESTLLDEGEQNVLIDESIDAALAALPDDVKPRLQRLVVARSMKAVRDVLRKLLTDRAMADAWAKAASRNEDAVLAAIAARVAPCTPSQAREALAAMRAAALPYLSLPAPTGEKATAFMARLRDLCDDPSSGDDDCVRAVCRLIGLLLKSPGELYASPASRIGTQPDWAPTGNKRAGQELYDALAGTIRAYVADFIGYPDERDRALLQMMRALGRTYELAATRYQATKRQRSALDYNDLETETLKILQTPGVAADVRRRIRHLLVDEFQDTNSTQWEIIRLLAADEWAEGTPWRDEAEREAAARAAESEFQSAAAWFEAPEPTDGPIGRRANDDVLVLDAPLEPGAAVQDAQIEMDGAHGLGADRLFIVGDAKQSIYAFRGADVSVYQASRAAVKEANRLHGTSEVPLTLLPLGPGQQPARHTATTPEEPLGEIALDTNFRSLPNLVHFTNGLFDDLMRPVQATRALHEAEPGPLRPHREPLAGNERGQIHLLITPDKPERYRSTEHPRRDALARQSARHIAFARIAQHIADHVGGGATPLLVHDEKQQEDRTACHADVAILVRRRTHLKDLERALVAYGIPYVVASGKGFWNRPEVWDQVNLVQFLADSHSDVALAGLLRSAFFGWTDDAVVAVALSDEKAALWDRLKAARTAWMPPQGFAGASPSEVVRVLEAARAKAGIRSTAEVIADVHAETGYIAALANEERATQAVANVDKVLRLIREREARRGIHLGRLVRELRRHVDDETDEAEAAIPGGAAGVRILTVHASKGLEFPIVYVPDLDGRFQDASFGDTKGFLHAKIDETHILATKVPGENGTSEAPILYTLVAREARARERAEAIRLLYVALTRARDHLFLQGASPRLFPDPKKPADPPARAEAKCWLDWIEGALGLGAEDLRAAFEAPDHRKTHTFGRASLLVDVAPPRRPAHGGEQETAPAAPADLEVPRPEAGLPPLLIQPSALETYRACPARFRYRHLDGLPDLRQRSTALRQLDRGQLLGTLVHRVLETTRADEEIPERFLARVRSFAVENGHEPTVMERDVLQHVAKARQALGDDSAAIKELVFEHAWAAGVRTRGAIDHLRRDATGWEIVDTKSDQPTEDPVAHATKAGYDAQIGLYAAAVAELSDAPVAGTIVYTSTGTQAAIPLAPDIDTLRSRLQETRGLTRNDERYDEQVEALWPPTPDDPAACSSCGFLAKYGGPCRGTMG